MLPHSRTADGAAALDAALTDPAGLLVGLDFDGTLAPIVARPEDARLADGAAAALARLSRVAGHVVIVTGRPVDSVLELGGFAAADDLDRLVVLGHYGLERWDATTGEVRRPEPHPGVASVRAALPEVLDGAPAGVEVEDKVRSVAVHTRNTGDPAATLDALRPRLQQVARDAGLDAIDGRFVVELRPPGVDKGTTFAAYIDEVQPRTVAFAGDDLGDLAAFDTVERLRAAGRVRGVTVCSASDEVDEVAARADVVVDGPAGVVAFLELLAASAQGA